MRVISYMLKSYKWLFLVVIAGIIVSAAVTVIAASFSQELVDSYIVPMLESGSSDFSSLERRLVKLSITCLIGIAAAYIYNRVMVNISQGTMNRLRKDIFSRMETLPIKYFDTHAHGDIMSVYTNDVDTLRQLLGQSMPQLVNSLIMMCANIVVMLMMNPYLSIISFSTAAVMVVVSVVFSSKSGKYYVAQQRNLGIVDGFIEEMLDGQKVVKVFCHEEHAKKDFDKINEELRKSADKANTYANLLMPINANIGWISYGLCPSQERHWASKDSQASRWARL